MPLYTVNKIPIVYKINNIRYYSSLNSYSDLDIIPIPILTLSSLNNKDSKKSYREILKTAPLAWPAVPASPKGGIYSFINTINGKQYIGSAKDFYLRFIEQAPLAWPAVPASPIENKKSNVALQKAFNKYGLDKFNFCIYEYFTYKSKIISNKALTDLETRLRLASG